MAAHSSDPYFINNRGSFPMPADHPGLPLAPCKLQLCVRSSSPRAALGASAVSSSAPARQYRGVNLQVSSLHATFRLQHSCRAALRGLAPRLTAFTRRRLLRLLLTRTLCQALSGQSFSTSAGWGGGVSHKTAFHVAFSTKGFGNCLIKAALSRRRNLES